MGNKQKMKTEKEMQVENSEVLNEDFSAPIWTKEEKELSKKLYGCEIMQEKCTQQELKNTQLPSDTYIISYYQKGTLFHDLVRGKRVRIFDMYYDKIGNCIHNIDFGYGKISPKLWGYQAPKSKKRK